MVNGPRRHLLGAYVRRRGAKLPKVNRRVKSRERESYSTDSEVMHGNISAGARRRTKQATKDHQNGRTER